MNPRTKAHLALFTVAVIYSLNYIIAKDVMNGYIGPRGFIFMRVVGASALFWLFHSFSKGAKPIEKKDWLRILLCGLFGVAGNQLMFFEGLNLTTPINASVLMTVNPILVLLLSAILLKESMSKFRVLGIVLGLSGALFLILGRGNISLLDDQQSLGNLLILLNASSYGVYLVIVKPLMLKYDALHISKWVSASGLLFVIPAGFGQFAEVNWGSWTPIIIAEAGFVVICTTFLAYLFNVYALKTVSSTTVSIYIYLQPLLATAVSLALGKDILTWREVVAAALIFTGVYLVSFSKK